MSTPEHDKLREFVRVDKKRAAISQLRDAMFIWFHHGDPVSIHTLAAAAHDCFHWMAKYKERESILRDWMKSQSKGFQKRMSDAQNFFKHGHKWLKAEIKYPPLYGELLMFDSIICYGIVFSHRSTPPLMRLYAVRFALENAGVLKTDLARYFLERDVIDELAPLSREEFFKRGLALCAERA